MNHLHSAHNMRFVDALTQDFKGRPVKVRIKCMICGTPREAWVTNYIQGRAKCQICRVKPVPKDNAVIKRLPYLIVTDKIATLHWGRSVAPRAAGETLYKAVDRDKFQLCNVGLDTPFPYAEGFPLPPLVTPPPKKPRKPYKQKHTLVEALVKELKELPKEAPPEPFRPPPAGVSIDPALAQMDTTPPPPQTIYDMHIVVPFAYLDYYLGLGTSHAGDADFLYHSLVLDGFSPSELTAGETGSWIKDGVRYAYLYLTGGDSCLR